jgi:hypothetical protein
MAQPAAVSLSVTSLSITDLSVDDLIQTDSNPLPHDLAVFPRITALLAKHIDSSLSCDEAVSLTFLVVDNPKIAHSLARCRVTPVLVCCFGCNKCVPGPSQPDSLGSRF